MVSRRGFFSQMSRALVANVADALEQVRFDSEAPEAPPDTSSLWLRPPGALPESEFLARCTQCTACQEACPYDSIRRLGPEFGLVAGTPVVIPAESPCYLCEDMPCIAACEPKALLSVAKHNVQMGTAVIDMSKCYVAAGQPCDYCVKRCPLGSDVMSFGSDGLPEVHSVGCTGCGVCVYLCPGDAIRIAPEGTKE